MQVKSFDEVAEKYELEIDRIVEEIKKSRAKRVLLQFPEGLKPYAQVICDEIADRSGAECFVWLESCFGACDTPLSVNKDIDLVVQFGHTTWEY